MNKIIDTLASAIAAKKDYDDWRSLMSRFIEIEYESDRIEKVAFGLDGNRIEITSEELILGSNARDLKVSLTELKAALEFLEYVREVIPPIEEGGLVLPEGVQINDEEESLLTTWSSEKIRSEIDSKAIAFGTIEPTDKTNNMLWFEFGSLFPQPWQWNASANQWRSLPQYIDLASPSNSTGSFRIDKVFNLFVTNLSIESFAILLSTRGASGDVAANYWTATISTINNSGTVTDLTNTNNQNSALNSLKRVSGTITHIASSPASLYCTFSRTGAATGLTVLGSVSLGIKYIRS